MGDVKKKQKLGEIFLMSRANTGLTQEQMAMALDVSKKTVHDWETGVSSPRIYQVLEWFRYLGLNPIPYLYAFLYPDTFDIPCNSKGTNERDTEKALANLISGLDKNTKEQLLFILSGHHGSSPMAEIQMLCAHCHTNMKSRVLTAQNVINSYDMDKETGNMIRPNDIQPDMNILRAALEQGKRAVILKQYGYNIE